MGFPPEVSARLAPVAGFDREIEGLLHPETFETAAEALHAGLPNDDGFRILSAMLEAAAMSETSYRERGIPERIYLDTMKCFPRFVREARALFGKWKFHLWQWAGRQTSMTLFRIGTLEFEKCEGPSVSVHIPSDADLSPAAVDRSLGEARAFFAKFEPAYAEAPFVCFSWMLDPSLGELLPPTSRVRMFAERFEVKTTEERDDYYQFIFKRPRGTPISELPEETSLQRALKARLAAGGRFGAGYGVMRGAGGR